MRPYRLNKVAELLDVPVSRVRELIRAGKLAAINVGVRSAPRYRVEADELQSYVDRQRVGAPERLPERPLERVVDFCRARRERDRKSLART